jgi:DNA-directed RNA polymerase subunit RPC12/RpoP
MKCSACGKEIDKSRFPSNITFCPYCGDDMRAEGTKMQFCPYCGEKLIIQASFCPHCGGKLVVTGGVTSAKKTGRVDFIGHIVKPVLNFIKEAFGHERKMKKLYKQWLEYSDLSPEDIPALKKDIKIEMQGEKGE